MDPIQVSIVMPVYNCAAFLPASLDSLLSQRGLSLEIIAVNDGSSDDSLAVLRERARADARLRVIDQANQGPSVARNAGLQAARGEWIVFADADDWVTPDTLREWHDLARSGDVDVLIGNGYRFATEPLVPTKGPLLQRQRWDEVMSGPDWIVHCTSQGEWPHYVWLQLIRRSLIEQHGLRFTPALLHEDILWTLHLALAARRVGFARRPAYAYRLNPDSIVRSPSQTSLARRAQSYVHILKALVDCAGAVRGNAALRRALLRHANVECTHLESILRKEMHGGPLRRDVARRLHEMKIWRALWRGASGVRQHRRLVRCYLTVARYRR
ncbi:glycosyltransferase [Bordetella genomosp. 8]|nr:glycosyltransferase [Bordetella genomosp. 8]